MRITQGAFSFLPDLTDDEIKMQLEYCLSNDWAVSIEHTDDAHPRNTYWDMWGAPMFDLHDPAGIMLELAECRLANPDDYVRINAFNSTHGVESIALSFIAQRPKNEPGFRIDRTETSGRTQRYSVVSYAVDRAPQGERYGAGA